MDPHTVTHLGQPARSTERAWKYVYNFLLSWDIADLPGEKALPLDHRGSVPDVPDPEEAPPVPGRVLPALPLAGGREGDTGAPTRPLALTKLVLELSKGGVCQHVLVARYVVRMVRVQLAQRCVTAVQSQG